MPNLNAEHAAALALKDAQGEIISLMRYGIWPWLPMQLFFARRKLRGAMAHYCKLTNTDPDDVGAAREIEND